MKKYDIYGGIFWAGLAIYMIATAIWSLGLGNPDAPGPGFFPLVVGFVLLIFGVLAVITATQDRKRSADFNRWPAISRNVIINVGVLLGYSLVLEYLGFILSSLLLLFYLFLFPGKRKWLFSLLFTIGVVSLSYYFFGVLLQAQFPEGIIA